MYIKYVQLTVSYFSFQNVLFFQKVMDNRFDLYGSSPTSLLNA